VPAEKEKSLTQIHEVYIRSTPEMIWDAITSPEWTARYGHRTRAEYDLRPGGKHRHRSTLEMLGIGLPETCIDGDVIEAKPPYRLVHTWRFLFSEENEAEGYTRVTWEIEPTTEGFCRLRVTHELEGAPLMAEETSRGFEASGGGGWSWILSDLKSLLETGKSMSG
jgi:uncharacterized protein YndB with AHSA1/START domain